MKRWFHRYYGSSKSAESTVSSSSRKTAISFPAFNPTLLSIPSHKFKHSKTTARHKQIEHVYSSLYWTSKLKSLVDAQIKIDKDLAAQALSDGNDGSEQWTTWAPLVTQQRITRDCWENETDEVKGIVMEKREALYQADVAAWNTRNEELSSPAKQQEYVAKSRYS